MRLGRRVRRPPPRRPADHLAVPPPRPGRRHRRGQHGAVLALSETAAERGQPLSHVLLRRLGGAVADRAHDATAFAHPHRARLITIVGGWTEAADRADGTAWAQRTWTAACRVARGTYVNHLENEGEQRVR